MSYFLLAYYHECTGSGQVEGLKEFNLTTGSVCVQWQQPYMCYNGLDSFLYHVFVEAIDLHETSTVTISGTSHCFPIDPCGRFMVTVMPSVEAYNGTMKSLLVNGLDGEFPRMCEKFLVKCVRSILLYKGRPMTGYCYIHSCRVV